MTDKLAQLLERAKKVSMSEAQEEQQRQSFAYGNTRIENDLITRKMVAEEAENLRNAD